MKVCYTSDLHGHWDHYLGLADLHKKEGFDLLLLGGDMLPRNGHDIHSLNRQIHFIKDRLLPYFKDLQNSKKVEIYILAGNNDWASAMSYFSLDPDSNVFLLNHNNPVPLNAEYFLIGYSYVPPTPFTPKDYERKDCDADSAPEMEGYISEQRSLKLVDTTVHFNSYPAIETDLNHLTCKDPRHLIFLSHSPPFQTLLDRTDNGSYGSRAIRSWIENVQPYLTLHGHIHEAPQVTGKYWERLGQTISINPGQEREQLSAVIFTLKDLSTLRHTLYGPAFGEAL